MREKHLRLVTALILPVLALLFCTAGARPAFAANNNCSQSTLHGNYSGNFTGTTTSAGNVAFQALINFDGEGGAVVVSGTLMSENSGPTSFTSNIIYTVDRNCNGTLTSTRSTGETTHYKIVVIGKGSEVNLLAIDPGSVVTGTLKSSRPGRCSPES